jgi:amino acid transporter
MLGASSLAAAGAENSAHMAEETHEAELIVPRAMFFATLMNYINVLIFQICCYVVCDFYHMISNYETD